MSYPILLYSSIGGHNPGLRAAGDNQEAICTSINCATITPAYCKTHDDVNISDVNRCCQGKFPFIGREDTLKDTYTLDTDCFVDTTKIDDVQGLYNKHYVNTIRIIDFSSLGPDTDEEATCDANGYIWCDSVEACSMLTGDTKKKRSSACVDSPMLKPDPYILSGYRMDQLGQQNNQLGKRLKQLEKLAETAKAKIKYNEGNINAIMKALMY
mgnify:CR=1 FL=1